MAPLPKAFNYRPPPPPPPPVDETPVEVPVSARMREQWHEFSTVKKGRLWTTRQHEDPHSSIWSVSQSRRAISRAFKHTPEKVAFPYQPPPQPPPPKKASERGRIKVAETKYTAEELEELAEQLKAQATSLEGKKPQPTGKFGVVNLTMGQALMSKDDMINETIKKWDAKGKGEYLKKEFRINLRSLNVTATSTQSDDLFDSWDADSDGVLTASDLRKALTAVMEEARTFMNAADPNAERAVALRARAQLAKDAATAVNEAERLEEAHLAFMDGLAKRVDLALGSLLTKRRIRPGEMVAMWSQSRGDHAGQLARRDFRTFCFSLGVDEGTTAREIDEVFDQYDDDKSGYMSSAEAKAMIKGLQLTANRANTDGRQKERTARTMRQKATKLSQMSMTVPSDEQDAAAEAEREAAAAAAAEKRRRKSRHSKVSNAGHALSDARLKLTTDVNGGDPEALKEASRKFSLRLQLQTVARAFSKFSEFRQERLKSMQRLKQAHAHMQQPALGGAMMYWADWKRMDAQRKRLVLMALNNFQTRGQQVAWRLWIEYRAECLKEEPAREARVERGLAMTSKLRAELRRRDLSQAMVRWNDFYSRSLVTGSDFLIPFVLPARRRGGRRKDFVDWIETTRLTAWIKYKPLRTEPHPLSTLEEDTSLPARSTSPQVDKPAAIAPAAAPPPAAAPAADEPRAAATVPVAAGGTGESPAAAAPAPASAT